ncbi:MAG TPA: nitroreductase family deazaflavin-dependent oxidoreductase [Methylomirabilota bacterium]|nr:nitroreductase family deazaflavin-dependent oxidoreductase [Methylomirabilota bacterium]
MAATYRLSPGRRAANRLVRLLLKLGLMPGPTYLLTVPGRRTGRPLSTPVTLVEEGAERWLVAPYGDVAWVRNARAAGQVTLTRGRHVESVSIRELSGPEAAPVLQRYVTRVPITRPYFDATPDSPLAAFEAEAPRHPVFALGSGLTFRHFRAE